VLVPFGDPSPIYFVARFSVQARIVHCDGCLSRDASQQTLVGNIENVGLRMTEEETANDFARP
jgi:hypothetical protein